MVGDGGRHRLGAGFGIFVRLGDFLPDFLIDEVQFRGAGRARPQRFAPKPGDRVVLSGGANADAPPQIDIDAFFQMPIAAENSRIVVGDAALECGGKPLATTRVVKGRVK